MQPHSTGYKIHRILALVVLCLVVLSALRMSYLGLGDAWLMCTDKVVQDLVPNAWMGGLIKGLAHLLVIGWCVVTLVGVVVRKRWGFLFAVGLLPVRLVWIFSIFKFGELLGLNLWRIEVSILESSIFLAIVLLPLLLIGRNMRDFYGFEAPGPRVQPARGTTSSDSSEGTADSTRSSTELP